MDLLSEESAYAGLLPFCDSLRDVASSGTSVARTKGPALHEQGTLTS